ncbi:DUF551 domain-containing protein [Enterobacter hormaechei]|uniref:DUF551 domain-containing protein n=1 Tax=Enterobacter hormaechei TaxID=158836 RepID=UPI00389016E9
MSTITKEWLQQKIADMEAARDEIPFGLDEDDSNTLAALRIALASLEVEPVAYMYKDNLHADARFSLHTRFGNWSQEDINEYEITEIPLYTTPPAPANAEPVAWLWSHRQHLSEVSLVRPEDDERAEGAHWSGWSCQALYAAPPAPVSVPDEVCWEDVPEEITEDDMALASAWAHGFNQCRAAMLKHSEPFIVTSDHRMMEMPQVEAINAVTAMLQGAEPVTTAYKLQDGWVACSERMPETAGNYWGWWSESKRQGPVWFIKSELQAQFQSSEITHWMPLPAAPQQEGKW